MPRQPNHPRSRRNMRRKARREQRADKSSSTANDQQTLIRARQFWQDRRFDEALAEFDRAVEQNPSDQQTLSDAARAHAQRFQIDRALSLIEQLRTTEGAGAAGRVLAAGLAAILAYRPSAAIACLEQVQSLSPGEPAAATELAAVYERQGHIDLARQAIDRVKPGMVPAADLVRARVLLRGGESAAAKRILEQLATSPAAPPPSRARAGYDLARLLDQQGDYDAAWQILSNAKQLQHTLLPPNHIEAVRARLNRHAEVIDRLTAENLARWTASDPHDNTHHPAPALLTGLPRSGTTLLARVLGAHPGIVTVDERQVLSRVVLPSLIDGDQTSTDPIAALDRVSPQRLAQQRTAYRTLMEQSLGESIGDRLLLDKNPAMNLLLPAARRLIPGGKLIIALRDPRDTLVSLLFTPMPMSDVASQMLSAEQAARHVAVELRAWLTLRDKLDGWIEVRYEDAVADLPGQARRMLESLSLPWDDAVLNYREKLAERQVDSPTYAEVAKPVYDSSIGRWKHYEPWLGEAFGRLNELCKQLGYAN